MTNMIQSAKDQVSQLTQAAYEKAAAAGLLPAGADVKATVEIPKDASHGDYASSFAMAGAKALRMAPRQIAQIIVDHLELEGSYFQKVEIAGPGFLNFTLGPKWFGEVLTAVEAQGANYGASPGRLGRLEGVLRQRRRQPDPQVRRLHQRPVYADPSGGGQLPLPGGGLPRGRHQGTGKGHP